MGWVIHKDTDILGGWNENLEDLERGGQL
jgi:hypothetical protein